MTPKILKANACRPLTADTVLWQCEADDKFDAIYLITRAGAEGGACDSHFTKEIAGKTVGVIVDVRSLAGLDVDDEFRTIFHRADAMIEMDLNPNQRKH